MKILVTGVAGFIGMHVAARLLARGTTVVGIDNLNDYYDVALKQARLATLTAHPNFSFARLDIATPHALTTLFSQAQFTGVVHLAAQAGVRYSLTHPQAYAQANLVGFLNILEACRQYPTPHLVYASSSSVYGGNTQLPFRETDRVDHPVSLYAATKKANELMAHAYSHLYALPSTGLRFFTVYGPWGRPDMALFKFTRAILAQEPVELYNYGQMQRDFTYIDDIVEGVVRVLDRAPSASPTPYRVLNIGQHAPASLLVYLEALEHALGQTALRVYLPMQAGDVPATFADTQALQDLTGFCPGTPIHVGVQKFVDWYRQFYAV
jgi:UDP-glucuronate 4-epimerase